MQNNLDHNDDFISSAGIPTIPLRTAPKRSYDGIIVYGLMALCLLAITVIGYDFVYTMASHVLASYDIVLIVSAIVLAIYGVVIKQKWLVFVGVLVISLIVGMMYVGVFGAISVPIALSIVMLLYRWYLAYRHYESTVWPLMLALLGGIAAGLMLMLYLGVLAAPYIAPILFCATCIVLIWQWRSK